MWNAVAAAVSIVIEAVQWLAPIDRTGSVLDLVVDVAGGCVGFVAVRGSRNRPRVQGIVLGVLGAAVLVVAVVLVWGLASSA